jgi:hypothetical protein
MIRASDGCSVRASQHTAESPVIAPMDPATITRKMLSWPFDARIAAASSVVSPGKEGAQAAAPPCSVPDDAAEAEVTGTAAHVLSLARRRSVALAVVRRTEV